jgi:membrane protease YdiL (CAAX protease family)
MPGFVPAPPRKLRRSLQFALFGVSLLWFLLSDALAVRAARGLTNRFDGDALQPLISALFLIFLLAIGFSIFEGIARVGPTTMRQAMGLPRRPTAWREWVLGAAIGWGLAVAAVLPMALGRTLHVRLWTEPRAFGLSLLNLLTLAAVTLGIEIALRGAPFRRLIAAIGPIWATIVMALLLAVAHGLGSGSTGVSIVVTLIASVMLSLAWLRTHGLWLSWGLHFAWNAAVGLLFGLPVRGFPGFAAIVQTRAIGPAWLTGDDFGPEAAVFTAIAMLVAIGIVVRTTGDYAWDYTRPELVPAGYEVNPPPPAAHTAMEQEVAAKGPGLVQILPTTPQTRSVDGYGNE